MEEPAFHIKMLQWIPDERKIGLHSDESSERFGGFVAGSWQRRVTCCWGGQDIKPG